MEEKKSQLRQKPRLTKAYVCAKIQENSKGCEGKSNGRKHSREKALGCKAFMRISAKTVPEPRGRKEYAAPSVRVKGLKSEKLRWNRAYAPLKLRENARV